ncbi:MAG: hypothetical protein AABY95_09890 [Pseudomonadota bacterium]
MSNKVLFLAVGSLALTAGAVFYSTESPDCSGGGRGCPRAMEAESPGGKLALYDERARMGRTPAPGALRAAVDQKAALDFFKAGVKGADGHWQAAGKGPLISSGLAQTLGLAPVPRTNLQNYAGRVDNFAYDEANKRLFAAPGTGGIWMSQARNGDVRTIGDYWTSIGDKLPTQANGGVIFTPVGGGTVISAGGDSVLSTGAYTGLGAYWSNDLGVTWTRSNGFPDGANVFNTETDPGHPNIVYIASSKGLYRSSDAGRNFANVRLPTGSNGGVECAGNTDAASPCNLVNVVTDVVVQAPGGVEIPGVKEKVVCSDSGCPVLAAVGWRAGRLPYPGTDIPQASANGLYKSDNGLPGENNWRKLDPAPVDNVTEMGFTPADRSSRIEFGTASGPGQDHNFVYALVADAQLLNGDPFYADDPTGLLPPVPTAPPAAIVLQSYGHLSGIFASPDFGETWTRMATTQELAPFSAFIALVAPGAQAYYNQWIQVDPTRTLPVAGIPTRLAFGLEEIWQSRIPHMPLNGTLQAGPADFDVLGRYFSGTGVDQTTHPDQHAAIFIPIDDVPLDGAVADGVCLFVGNDGGVFRQCVSAGGEFTNAGWGGGNNSGFYTLLPYGLGVAKDGTVWFGFQDNGSGHMEPDTGISYGDFGADGFYAEVDPDDSDIAYTETQNGGLRRTSDRGLTSTFIDPPYERVNFANWFSMDPLDGNHMITTANQVYETDSARTVTGSSWVEVHRVGEHVVVDPVTAAETTVVHTATVGDVHDTAIYVGWCGDCGVTVNDQPFLRGLDTNVTAAGKPAEKLEVDSWHNAAAKGLPNRLIMAIEIDPTDPKTVYVGLGGYMSPYRGPGSFGENSTGADLNAGNLFKSTDAGETFKDITGNLPRLPVSTIVARNGQLLVGTDAGAFISSDTSGKQWATLGNDLPNAPVTMLKLQPGNPNKLYASTFGRHIWTYEFTGDAAVKAADAATSGKQGRGLFLGAFSPWMLLGLLCGALKRATRLRPCSA